MAAVTAVHPAHVEQKPKGLAKPRAK